MDPMGKGLRDCLSLANQILLRSEFSETKVRKFRLGKSQSSSNNHQRGRGLKMGYFVEYHHLWCFTFSRETDHVIEALFFLSIHTKS